MSKLWQKDYEPDKLAEAYAIGDDYLMDQQLLKYDCLASMAHAKMLRKLGIFDDLELDEVLLALQEIIDLDANGNFAISPEQEDMHTAIEEFLVRKLGDTGKKIHTGRSRNDQVLTALRLYYKDALEILAGLSQEYLESLKNFRNKFGQIEMPGYTHTRKAMPSSIDLWTTCWIDSMEDNLKLVRQSMELVDQSPLGTAAGYGSPLPLDREFTAKNLGFAKVQENPIYCQLSRGKFEATIVHAITQIMFDFNRMSADLILFSSDDYGFFEIPKEFSAGSSIMPQKYNADILEILRSNYHVIISKDMLIKNCQSGLITGYNTDVRPIKSAVIKSFRICYESLVLVSSLFAKLEVNEENCRRHLTPEVYATHEAYELVQQGIPFREAYKQIAKKYAK